MMQTLVIILSIVIAYLVLVIVLAWAMRLKGVRERMTHLKMSSETNGTSA